MSSRRRKRRGFRRFFNRKNLSIAQKALSTALTVKRLVNVERKYKDTSYSASLSGSGAIMNLIDIPQGDTSEQRIGNSIKLTNVLIRGDAIINSADTNSLVRLVLVRDLQQQGDSPPVWLDIFDTATPNTALNRNNAGRFKILADRRFTLSKNGQDVHLFKIFKKLNFHVRYNGPLATDFQKNGLYLAWITGESTNLPTIDVTARVSYIDN